MFALPYQRAVGQCFGEDNGVAGLAVDLFDVLAMFFVQGQLLGQGVIGFVGPGDDR